MPLVQQGSVELFSERALSDLIRNQLAKADFAIEQKDTDELLSMPIEDQVDIIVAHFGLVLRLCAKTLHIVKNQERQRCRYRTMASRFLCLQADTKS
jgi:hypothetical protein